MLIDKINKAKQLIENVLIQYSNPIVYSSFGKDSMVLLDLINQVGLKLPVMFHRESHLPVKYAFANSVIEQNNYSVYDYPPHICTVTENDNCFEIINWHNVGKMFMYLPTGIDETDKEPTLCGLHDIFMKPKAKYSYPWDIGFIGQKSSDLDPIMGQMTLNQDIQFNQDSADFAYPIRDFTDEDIWNYAEVFGIPIHTERYDPENNFKEFSDRKLNPDYFPACIACMSRKTGPSVWCFRMNSYVSNISREIPFTKPGNNRLGPEAATIGG